MQCDVSSALLILAAAEFTALIEEQAVALIDERNKRTKKRSRFAAESDLEGDIEDSDDNDGDTSKADTDDDSCDDNNPYSWIGRWVQKPNGECCRNSKEGRDGFTTARLLKQARITKVQYALYKVSLLFTFRHTTDSPQKTAHQLIGHYFDTSHTYWTNIQTHPDSWVLIMEKVCSDSFLFYVYTRTLHTDETTSPALPMACEKLGD
jgi:hypothetical protein